MTRTAPPGNPDIGTRLDPELRHLVDMRTVIDANVLDTVRESMDRRRHAAAQSVDTAGVDIVDDRVPAAGSAIPVRIYRAGPTPAPAVLYFHGGAFVLGNLDTDHLQCVEFARRARCTVISVDYRLAPEHPYPAGFDDARTVLEWAATNTAALGIDAERIALAGNSAGGALAAGLAQCAARAEVPPVVFQLLHQPALDDRPSPSKEEFTTTPGIDGAAAALMWQHYAGESRLPAAAAPARSDDLAGLPTAFITCAELDPLRDEAIDYALRLLWAGVSTELHVFAGTCHGFDSMVPDCAVSRQLFAMQGDALRRALHG